MNLEAKREQELKTVSLMIDLYQRGHRKTMSIEARDALKEYAGMKIGRCPRMEEKTFCSSCPTHCWQKEKQKQIRDVMRYAGPRMLFYHPVLAIRHLIDSYQEKRKKHES